MTVNQHIPPEPALTAPTHVDSDTRTRLLDLARRAEDMHGVRLVNEVATIAGERLGRPWVGFAALVDAVMILDGLTSHSLDPAVVSDHTDRDAAIREWEQRAEDAIRMVLSLPTAVSMLDGA